MDPMCFGQADDPFTSHSLSCDFIMYHPLQKSLQIALAVEVKKIATSHDRDTCFPSSVEDKLPSKAVTYLPLV